MAARKDKLRARLTSASLLGVAALLVGCFTRDAGTAGLVMLGDPGSVPFERLGRVEGKDCLHSDRVIAVGPVYPHIDHAIEDAMKAHPEATGIVDVQWKTKTKSFLMLEQVCLHVEGEAVRVLDGRD